ncbi:hypothetical protein KIN20_024188 [Parelaphostrongylus tenuis]|uniref:Uncharacterized protein n=1 Tax=Parelaphostrongylus tenuis TaxID=148309 RepID=A0AAD5QVT2_PARTN|nr:hypothetical protein KIN20_024188 [Parelaphostrongylus tenuis]
MAQGQLDSTRSHTSSEERENAKCASSSSSSSPLFVLKRIVTTDEKWIFLKSQRCPNQWLSPGQQGTPTPRSNRFVP